MGSSVSSDVIAAAQIPIALLAAIGLDGVPWPPQAPIVENSSYDYIVIGGGTAGSVVARRLAEDKTKSVLVLEAGADPPLDAILPGLFVLLPGSYVDYSYKSSQDEYTAKSQNGYTKFSAGKMLGGSASLNHFIHLRGPAEDYDSWAKISNDSSWEYNNVLPYFIKSETMADIEIIRKYGKFHGTKGPMGITRDLRYKKMAPYLESFAEVGNPTVLDLNADINVGYSPTQYIIADEKRQTPAYSYLEPIKDNSNLYISKKTRATKIIFENKVAVAIEAVRDGKTYTIRAKKEIILSAGVFNSPQLLMLSGIGPKEHLEAFNIDVISDLPVGNDLTDQVSVTLVHKLEKHLLPIPNPISLLNNPTKINFPVFIGSAALNKSQTSPNYQTYNLLFSHDTPYVTIACKILFGFRNDICDRLQKQVISRNSLYTLLLNVQQKSRGTVRLESINPFADPVITTGFYTKDEDLENMVKFVKDFKSVGNSKYFKGIGAELVGLDLPECADKVKDSDDFWKCFILNYSSSPFHSAGTCAMGKVVDGRLKVKGVENLRVVDASVMPFIPRGGPNAAVVMLAELASDMIKKDHNSS